jgi:exodeoxyribonuclease VII small subunit
MSPPRPASDAEPAPKPERFEELLARLETIVSDMEGADLPLEKLLSSYEEGMRLVKACGDRLADAEQKVEILSRVASGMASPSSAAASATPVSPSLAAPLAGNSDTAITPPPVEDDIRLI